MALAMPIPERDRAKQLLGRHWDEVVAGEATEESVVAVGGDTRDCIRELMSSEAVTFTYSLPTQLLGKLTNPRLDALCLQRGDEGDDSKWDPRSFASRVVVPWVRDNDNVLGRSSDPYVSNPLRQPRVLPSPPGVRSNTLPLWKSLHGVLNEVQQKDDPDYTLAVFRSVLLAVYEKLEGQKFSYPALPRVSVEQTLHLVGGILSESREGEHAMSLAAALFKVVGRQFGLWAEVIREGSTAADLATGMVGDLECRQNGRLVYAVEVKEQQITLADVRSFEAKLNRSELREALINAPGVSPADAERIDRHIRLMWRRGVNLHRLSIMDLVRVVMSLCGEQGRVSFVKEVGAQLDGHARPSGRIAWRKLLNEVLEGAES